jgi:hypothetical protein
MTKHPTESGSLPTASSRADENDAASADAPVALKRRGWLIGAGSAGAAVAAVAALPLVRTGAPSAAPAASATAPVAASADGYQLTAHVLRYYETARI